MYYRNLYLFIILSLALALLPPTSKTQSTKLSYSKLHHALESDDRTYLSTNKGLILKSGDKTSLILAEETFCTAVSKGRILASTRSGIHISDDGGSSWIISSRGLPEKLVALSIQFADERSVYIGTDRHGVFLSEDAAESWQPASEGLPPAIGINKYAAIKRLAVSPLETNTVYACTDSQGVYVTRDKGSSWSKVALDLPGKFHHRVPPAIVSFDMLHRATYILVNFPIHSHLLEHSIHRSYDGQSWERIKTLPPNQMIFDMQVEGAIAHIVTSTGIEQVDLRLPALFQETVNTEQSSIYPGTEPDYDVDNIAIIHDDGTLYTFQRNDLTDFGARVAKRFFQRHPDQYDILVTFAETLYPTPTAGLNILAYNVPIVNQTMGLGMEVGAFNGGPQAYGSSGRLKNFINMNRLLMYPANPSQSAYLTNSTLDILSHEVGHCWGAFYHFDDSGVTSNELLGRQLAHWSFFFNSDASFLEGNRYLDLGSGRFRTIAATSTYNELDRYGIGVLSAPSPVYVISNPTDFDPDIILSNGSALDPSSPIARTLPPLAPPEYESIQVTGTRKDVTFGQIVAVEGPRVPPPSPDLGRLSVGFILLVFPGREPEQRDIDKLKRIRDEWITLFKNSTGGSGIVDSTLITTGGSDTKAPLIKLLSPNGGETFESGSTIQINWTSSDENGIAKQDIELSLDGGTTYPIPIASYLNGKTTSYSYKLPVNIFSDKARIRIKTVDYAGNRSEDISDSTFVIKPESIPPQVRVKSPNGGEAVVVLKTLTISWESSDNAGIATHDVSLSTDGGRTFPFRLATGLGANVQEFVWSVPQNLLTTNARIEVRAVDVAGNVGKDISDESFSIVLPDTTPPQIAIHSPTEGEKLQAGTNYLIRWTATDNDAIATQEVAFSTDGGATFSSIIASGLTGTASSLLWKVPDIEIVSARVRVTATDRQQNRASTQSGVFAITRADVSPPIVEVKMPNGGEKFTAGEVLRIEWDAKDSSQIRSQRISLSTDGGTTFNIPVAEGLTGGVRSLLYNLPRELQPTTKARIRVEATDEHSLTGADISDADFSIEAADTTPPTVQLISPNGGEVFASDTAIQVSWQSKDNVGIVSHELELSTDGGNTFARLISGISADSKSVLVELTKGEKLKLRLKASDRAGNTGSDTSDGNFAVIDRPVIDAVEYKKNKKLVITARNVTSASVVYINEREFRAKFKQGKFNIKGSREELGLRSGENFIKVSERGVESAIFRLKL
ncbi:MAG: Ig-like domain-containing protein [Acidobacteriota bacterium]|nr:Ig-like domain-containing protein [Blastocatellia bacterium]MDW8413406.1 Ig-like domain-containing protein [Acidobacteriota bacterium]